MKRSHRFLLIAFMFSFFLIPGGSSFTTAALAADTVIVTAEGLADPNADTYRRDKGLLLDALLDDAKRQAIEKVVGIYVEGQSLVQNYSLIQDSVLSQTRGLIKTIHKQSKPWLGKDGFMHILIKAEVYTEEAKDALREMSKSQRVDVIRDFGNPRISVQIKVRDSKRSVYTHAERSEIAENVLKEHISRFGYRVWSEDTSQKIDMANAEKSMVKGQSDMAAYYSNRQNVDFSIRGEVKFKPISITLKASNLKIDKFQITSWTVKCLDNRSGEEIYFNNKIPTRMSWNTEDAAVSAVGELIGEEFSSSFFESQMMQPSKIYQLEVSGFPSYDVGVMLKKELIGLRPILNVDFRSFEASSGAVFEVEFAGTELKFAELLNTSILGALNAKFRKDIFHLEAVQGDIIKVSYRGSRNEEKVLQQFENNPPSSMASATPERIGSLALSSESLNKIKEINPKGVEQAVAYQKNSNKSKTMQAVENF